MSLKLPKGFTHDEFFQRISQEYNNALDFRRPAVVEWHENENLLAGKKPKTISKRSNVMVQLAAGFEDTLLAKVKNPPILTFDPTEEADKRKARKVSSLWTLESSVTFADWEYKDILTKKLAIPTGRAIFKVYAMNKPYKHYLEPIDPYDFLIDPMAGGMDIEKANYCGQDNIFKTKHDLESNPSYDQVQVKALIDSYSEDNQGFNTIDNQYREKRERFMAIGFDQERYSLQKEGLFKLTEWYTYVDGTKHVATVCLDRKTILKCSPLTDAISSFEEDEEPLYPFDSWAYYPDLFNFWSPAPLSKVRELFYLRNVVINQIIDNNEAKNKPMKSYDPNVYTKPALLEYRPDGLVPVKPGTDPKKGLHVHESPDLYNPKDLSAILEDLTGQITGVTNAAGGNEDANQKVGIYYGNMQEVAGRMSLFELSYTRCFIKLGKKYVNCLRDHLDEPKAVKMIGVDGVEWDKLAAEDLTEFDILFSGGITQAKKDAIQAKQKIDYINQLMTNPVTGQLVNMKFAVEQGATSAGFSALEAKKLITPSKGNEDIIGRALDDIQKLLRGETVKPPLNADTDYVETIFNFRYENNLAEEQDMGLADYIDTVIPMVIQNMMMKGQKELAMKGQLPVPGQEPAGMSPMGGSQPGSEFAPPADGLEPNSPGAINAQASAMPNAGQATYPNQPQA